MTTPPAADPSRDQEAISLRIWGGIVVVAAIALFLGGGALEGFRPPEPAGLVEGVELPVLTEPRGLIERPPTTFRWSGGGEPDLVQLVIYDTGYLLHWESRPLPPGTTEWDIPGSVFAEEQPGIKFYWRIRQVADGKPHANSDMVEFTFRLDSRGRARGEGPPPERRIR